MLTSACSMAHLCLALWHRTAEIPDLNALCMHCSCDQKDLRK